MFKNYIKIFSVALIIISCENKSSQEAIPTLNQSVEYIIHKIHNTDIELSDGVFTKVSFEVEGSKCLYKYEYISSKLNAHYEVVELFDLKDITFASSNSFSDHEYISLELTSKVKSKNYEKPKWKTIIRLWSNV